MREFALSAAAALAVVSFNPAVAKVVHRHAGHAQAPTVYHGGPYAYDYQLPYGYGDRYDYELPNRDCDVINKAPMTTCPNGG
jgi:hypothetical protein